MERRNLLWIGGDLERSLYRHGGWSREGKRLSACCGLPYNVDDIVNFKTSIREYVEGDPNNDSIASSLTDPAGAYVLEPMAARRMRLNPEDFKQHGYTKDCPGCASLRECTMVRAQRNHTEACRSRLEEIIGDDRVRRAEARHERELDERIQ